MRHPRAVCAPLVVSAAILVAAPAPVAATLHGVSIALACQASTPLGVQTAVTSAATFGADGPAQVAPGATFTERLRPPPLPVPTSLAGFPVAHLRDVLLRVRLRGPAAVVGVRLVGGHSPGATATITGGVVTFSAPAAVRGGQRMDLPDALLAVRVTGPVGSVITTDVPGTSYRDWTVQATARFALGRGVDVRASCYAQPVGAVLMLTKVR